MCVINFWTQAMFAMTMSINKSPQSPVINIYFVKVRSTKILLLIIIYLIDDYIQSAPDIIAFYWLVITDAGLVCIIFF
jgi:hypothetical protein